MRGAVAKRFKRRSHRRSTLERGVVQHPPYLELVTARGPEHGGNGPSFVVHSKRLTAKLGWIWQEQHCPKASSERCLRKPQGTWTGTLAMGLRRSKSSIDALSAPWAIGNEPIQRNDRPAYVQRCPLVANYGITRTDPPAGRTCWRWAHLQRWRCKRRVTDRA